MTSQGVGASERFQNSSAQPLTYRVGREPDALMDLSGQVGAVRVGQSDIQDHDVVRPGDAVDGLLRRHQAAGCDDVIAVRAENLLIGGTDGRIVVDDEQKGASVLSVWRGHGGQTREKRSETSDEGAGGGEHA